ncbi:MAG: hypothetical protein Unbinned3907contig1000_44 [Prokaryotic dsDNA virus sp.]|nr:MAG: hypothetical protein Unbinned3907contig1000_44 [Prokaryotic dsDNA virus sp.]|tara:strand:- start:1158 stop:1967 length:810 start_codon:yes stop_codon:yes gene_type:complete
MKKLKLTQVEHETKIGQDCPYIEANVSEDCLLEVDGEVVGFYIKDIKKYSKKLSLLLAIANKEFQSDNVPKSLLERSDVFQKVYKDGMTRKEAMKKGTVQMSTILGSIAPKPHMRRPYPNISAVHRVESARIFIKSMWAISLLSEEVLKEITPHIHKRQVELFEDIDSKWRFGNIFTSSISNFNIAAPFHRDTGNIVGTVNVILTKRRDSKGGSLHVPDYNATFEQADDSMLVYPAWKNTHGVTPIIKEREKGYRNSLIFYPLKAFKGI